MTRYGPDTGPAPSGSGGATLDALRRAVGTRPRRWLLVLTVLSGLLAVVAVTVVTPAADRTSAALSDPVQSLMSVAVPFLGVLLVHDLRRAPRAGRLAPTLLAAALSAALIGVLGVLGCAAALALTPSAPDAWRHAATIAVGGVLVQVVAMAVGTGLGLLLRSFVVAALATIVLPLGLWFALGGADSASPAQAWLTPYATVRNLLSGEMSGLRWAQWVAVLLLWGVGLNAVGAVRLRRAPG